MSLSNQNWVKTFLIICIVNFQNVGAVIPTTVSLSRGESVFFDNITPFETILVLITIIQLGMLRFLEVLPLNLNKMFRGDYFGRRKRRTVRVQMDDEDFIEMLDALLKILKKVDENQCGARTLCDLGVLVSLNNTKSEIYQEMQPLPPQILIILKLLTKFRNQNLKEFQKPFAKTPLSEFKEMLRYAFEYGVTTNKRHAKKACEAKYPNCKVTTKVIFSYVNLILN